MTYNQIRESILAQWAEPGGQRIVFDIVGKPGGGKSACARDIMRSPALNLDFVVEFNGSIRDTVDLMGLPIHHRDGQFTQWLPPEEFWRLREGRVGLIIEELSDCPVPMQNALCRVIYDNIAGSLPLSPTTFKVATSNSTEHKSGATRKTTKLSNRMRRIDFHENLEEWVSWAIQAGLKDWTIDFLKFRPELFCDFDPNRDINPTPRAWERVSAVPDTLIDTGGLFYEHVTGDVGPGPAAEYTAFVSMAKELPDPYVMLQAPDKAMVPTKKDVLYAVLGALARLTAQDLSLADAFNTYLRRLPKEYRILGMNDAQTRNPKIAETKAYSTWTADNYDAFL